MIFIIKKAIFCLVFALFLYFFYVFHFAMIKFVLMPVLKFELILQVSVYQCRLETIVLNLSLIQSWSW